MEKTPLLEQFESQISSIAEQWKKKTLLWINGYDGDNRFCPDCVEKKLAELEKENPNQKYSIDGGWGPESSDSLASCEDCQTALDVIYNETCIEDELTHFETYGFNPSEPSDCHSMMLILDNDDLPKFIDRVAAIACEVA